MSQDDILFDKLIEKRQKTVETLMDYEVRGVWHSVIGKYSSEAHFINELLQNADDCNATHVSFDISNEGLWFKHNGRVKFTISDIDNAELDSKNGTLGHINAITGIGNTGKLDQQKIGKFGIGFKAVFAYTSTPEIYDDNFSFRLENYLVPVKIEPLNQNRKQGETLFYFPFNNVEKPSQKAYEEIINKLKSLKYPLLFLSNLQEIVWKSVEENGIYKKAISQSITINPEEGFISEIFNISSSVNNKRVPEKIWIFSKDISNPKTNFTYKISVGFRLDINDRIITDKNFDAYCYFPTKETTNLPFLLNAPFLLTDNRQNILAGEEWNNLLVQNLAELTANTIFEITQLAKKSGFYAFGDDLLSVVPYKKSDFTLMSDMDKISFLPFYTEIKAILQNEEILPGRNNTFFKSSEAYWATDSELVSLFSDEQISDLLNIDGAGFVFTNIGQKNASYSNTKLAEYVDELVVRSYAPEQLIRLIDEKFIKKQTLGWLLKFYEYLKERDSYRKIAIDYPIILNQNKKPVIPFDKHRKVFTIFLPTETETDFDTIHPDYLKYPTALDFFKQIGITVPDTKDYFLNKILPLYEDDEIVIEDDDYKNHIALLLDFYKNATREQTENLLKITKNLPILRVYNNNEPEDFSLNKSLDTYFPTDDLKIYFETCEDIYFIDEEFYRSFLSSEDFEVLINIFKELGLMFLPRILTSRNYVYIEDLERYNLSEYSSYTGKIIFDKSLEGLDNALKNITPKKSEIIWSILLQLCSTRSWFSDTNIYAEFNYRNKGRGNHGVRTKTVISSLIISLRENYWIYDDEGNTVQPKNISKENISAHYDTSHSSFEYLCQILEISSEVVDPELNDDQKEIYDIGKTITAAGFSEEEVLAALQKLKAERESMAVKEQPTEKLFDIEPLPEDKPVVAEKKKNVIKTLKNLQQDLFDNFPNDLENNTKIVTPRFVTNDEDLPDTTGDFNPPINLEEEYQKRVAEVQREIEELANVESLKNQVIENEKYSYGWFKALMELEHLKGTEENSSGKEVTITFAEAFLESSDGRILVLKKPNRYIPHDLEDQPDITLKINEDGKTHQVSVEVVNVQEYTIKAKVRRKDDLRKINFNKVKNVVIDIKNPIFLLDELKKNIDNLSLEDDYNLKKNITAKIKFIFGPPGTGKTTYLATDEIIPLMKQKENAKVLVLTPTNKAADVLTARIMEKMGENKSYQDWLIRFGTTSETKITEELDENFKNIDIEGYDKAVVISTIARFSYDYFQKIGSSHRENIRHFTWDYIIIDEASMITLPNMVNVLYSQSQADFIIAGDPFQITPISKVQEWKDENIYTMVNLLSFTEPKTEPHDFEIVNRYTQYRSLPSIGQLFSIFSYDGKLLHHRTVDTKQIITISGMDLKDLNVIKFPVQKNQSIFSPNSLNGSKYHIYSALFSVEMAMKFAEEIAPQVEDTFRIGIICPYRAQANIIEKMLAQQHINNTKVEIVVGTIHGFQGDECNMIITVFNPPYKITGGPDMFLNKQNILNVAISRARDYLVILMPDDKTQDIGKLQKVKQIANLCLAYGKENYAEFSSIELEKKLFGSNSYIFDNSFATKHQEVNVYSDPVKKYEVRCEDRAVDIQIRK